YRLLTLTLFTLIRIEQCGTWGRNIVAIYNRIWDKLIRESRDDLQKLEQMIEREEKTEVTMRQWAKDHRPKTYISGGRCHRLDISKSTVFEFSEAENKLFRNVPSK